MHVRLEEERGRKSGILSRILQRVKCAMYRNPLVKTTSNVVACTQSIPHFDLHFSKKPTCMNSVNHDLSTKKYSGFLSLWSLQKHQVAVFYGDVLVYTRNVNGFHCDGSAL